MNENMAVFLYFFDRMSQTNLRMWWPLSSILWRYVLVLNSVLSGEKREKKLRKHSWNDLVIQNNLLNYDNIFTFFYFNSYSMSSWNWFHCNNVHVNGWNIHFKRYLYIFKQNLMWKFSSYACTCSWNHYKQTVRAKVIYGNISRYDHENLQVFKMLSKIVGKKVGEELDSNIWWKWCGHSVQKCRDLCDEVLFLFTQIRYGS